ncbi:MAG: hypothetical protein HYW71_01165 [Candidatus Niyogibacteria bacterium]|nr:hypothetical protein [Candidatus Niyogibacteria bacterium]
MTLKYRRKLLFLSIAVFFIITPLVLLYTAGYRLANNWSLAKTGGIYIYSPLSSSEIFIDNNLEKQTNLLQGGVFIQNLKPDVYSALVAKENYWPWQKNLKINPQLVTEARAFLIPRSPEGKTLARGPFISVFASPFDEILILEELKNEMRKIVFYLPASEEFMTNASISINKIFSSFKKIGDVYWPENQTALLSFSDRSFLKTEFDFENKTVRAFPAPAPEYLLTENEGEDQARQFIRFDKHKKLKIWLEKDNEIWTEWLEKNLPLPYYLSAEKEMIIKTRSPIKNIDFFPLREDVIIFAAENGIFALEIDGRGNRNMQPIYKGKNPTFAVRPSQKTVYVLDGGALSKIEL